MARDGPEEAELHRQWEKQEIPFLLDDRPWERAGAIVTGRPALEHDPATQVVTLTNMRGNHLMHGITTPATPTE
jgi:hypothetical protein